MSATSGFVKWLFDPEGPTTTKDIEKVYTEWADTYDNDMRDWGCTGQHELVKTIMAHITNEETTVLLDIAAGTGIIPQLLREQGYKGIIDGTEANINMLSKAMNKKSYRQYVWTTTTPDDELPSTMLESEAYDGITVAGGFLPKHLHQDCLVHIIRVLKHGGVIVFYTRNTGQIHEEYTLEMDKVVQNLVGEGKLELVEERNVLHFQNIKHDNGEDLHANLYVCKKL